MSNRSGENLKCPVCEAVFYRQPSRVKRSIKLFCSIDCRARAVEQRILPLNGSKGWFRKKQGASYLNVEGYNAIHMWVRRNWGRANTCDVCKGSKSDRFEWANKSGEYNKYDRNDWLQLCKQCHWEYDNGK